MKSTALQRIARLCRNLAGERVLNRPDDRDLLALFTGARDEAAFAAILDRHSRLVWAVCRGLLPNDADAEDAFQATFVALFLGAARIRHTRSLAPWLHTAATRIAKKVRLAAARRRGHERRAARALAAPTAVSNETWEALNLAVHDEINRLPARLRAAFVLCVLEGQRHQDAAAQLGVPVGTISARISRARDRLLAALSARGLTASAVALPATRHGGLPGSERSRAGKRTAAGPSSFSHRSSINPLLAYPPRPLRPPRDRGTEAWFSRLLRPARAAPVCTGARCLPSALVSSGPSPCWSSG
jgi:RNA polymerase sigma factor (sigma-70 family)